MTSATVTKQLADPVIEWDQEGARQAARRFVLMFFNDMFHGGGGDVNEQRHAYAWAEINSKSTYLEVVGFTPSDNGYGQRAQLLHSRFTFHYHVRKDDESPEKHFEFDAQVMWPGGQHDEWYFWALPGTHRQVR